MPPKRGKKGKAVKKVVTGDNPMQEQLANALKEKTGLGTTDSEYGSELNPTPRESGVDDSFADQSFQEHKEEEDHNSAEKKGN